MTQHLHHFWLSIRRPGLLSFGRSAGILDPGIHRSPPIFNKYNALCVHVPHLLKVSEFSVFVITWWLFFCHFVCSNKECHVYNYCKAGNSVKGSSPSQNVRNLLLLSHILQTPSQRRYGHRHIINFYASAPLHILLPLDKPTPPTHTHLRVDHLHSTPPQRFPSPEVPPGGYLQAEHPPWKTSSDIFSNQNTHMIISGLWSSRAGISFMYGLRNVEVRKGGVHPSPGGRCWLCGLSLQPCVTLDVLFDGHLHLGRDIWGRVADLHSRL